jgi:hypothetical protein
MATIERPLPRSRRRRARAALGSLAAGLLLAPVLLAQPPSSSPLVREIALLREDAGRVAWSAQGDWLAFDRPTGERGTYQLWIMKRDGTFERCLTCEPLDLRRENCINPAWHPSGDWILFQVQSPARRLGLGAVELATAERGLHSELWAIRRDGKGFWQLTRVGERGGAILDPEFSHEGGEVLWSERVSSRAGRWGEWVLRVASFRPGAAPRLAKPRTFEPGEQRLFLAGSSFTPDDRGALLAGNLEPGQPENGMDVYRLTFEAEASPGGRAGPGMSRPGEAPQRLTHTARAWDERARYTVKGDRILWVSASEIAPADVEREPGLPFEQLRDLWVMKPDGSAKERLTFFNHRSSRESLGAAIVDDFVQSPAGDEILAHVIWSDSGEIREALYRIALDESFRR